MSQDREKLLKELAFIEDSFKSGIITQSEYQVAKTRVEDKLAKEKESEDDYQPKEKLSAHDIIEQVSPPPQTAAPQEQSFTPQVSASVKDQEDDKADTEKIRLETYGNNILSSKKIYVLLGIAVILLLVIFWPSQTLPQIEQTPLDKLQQEEFIPVCETDLDCQREGSVGTCLNPASKEASCSFTAASVVDIIIIDDENCPLCDTSRMQNTLKQLYPGAKYSLIDRFSAEAQGYIERLDIDVLPAYIVGKEVENTVRFEKTNSILIPNGDLYVVKQIASGSPYFFSNIRKPNMIELYFDPSLPSSKKAVENLNALASKKQMDVSLRYVTKQASDEEILRQVCVRENTRANLLSYSTCRLQKSAQECLAEQSITEDQITSCMQGPAEKLLESDLKAASSFGINTVPVYIINNQYKKGGSLSVDLLESVYCQVNAC